MYIQFIFYNKTKYYQKETGPVGFVEIFRLLWRDNSMAVSAEI